MPRRSTPNAFRNYALALRAQTIEAGRRARRELMLLIPLLVAIALAYAFRDQLFGTDQPVRLATAGADPDRLGLRAQPRQSPRAPARQSPGPGSAGVVGFLVRFLALLAIVLVSLRIAGVELGAVAVGASFTAVIIGLAAQQTVGNILAGFVLISTHPFQVGDRVRFSGFGMDVEGTVAAHGLLHLTLTDGDDVVRIPNNTALTMSIRPLRQPAAVDMRPACHSAATRWRSRRGSRVGSLCPPRTRPISLSRSSTATRSWCVSGPPPPTTIRAGGLPARSCEQSLTCTKPARPRGHAGTTGRATPREPSPSAPGSENRREPVASDRNGRRDGEQFGNNLSETEPISDTGSVPEQA